MGTHNIELNLWVGVIASLQKLNSALRQTFRKTTHNCDIAHKQNTLQITKILTSNPPPPRIIVICMSNFAKKVKGLSPPPPDAYAVALGTRFCYLTRQRAVKQNGELAQRCCIGATACLWQRAVILCDIAFCALALCVWSDVTQRGFVWKRNTEIEDWLWCYGKATVHLAEMLAFMRK